MRRAAERPVPRRWLGRDARLVAPELLGKILRHGERAGRIVEVEAYVGGEDPGSHAFRGPTPRNAVMFGPAGHLYCYRSYGIHVCCNVVCGPVGTAAAVLVRALEPVDGLDGMRAARGPTARRDVDLCSGPGKLCQALGIDLGHDGCDLGEGPVMLVEDGTSPPPRPAAGTRIGLSAGADLPWRWWVAGNPNVSRPPR